MQPAAHTSPSLAVSPTCGLIWRQFEEDYADPAKVCRGDWYATQAGCWLAAPVAIVTAERNRDGSIDYYALHIRSTERRRGAFTLDWSGHDTYRSLERAREAAEELARRGDL